MKPELDGDAVTGVVLTWPDGVAKALGTSRLTLYRMRANGDAPQLYALSERQLVTTPADVLAWVKAKAVPVTYRCRAPVPNAGRPRKQRDATEAGA
jgi:predicted DNA-binding transcriptional regulator AlpA